jgi:hypothetical protein
VSFISIQKILRQSYKHVALDEAHKYGWTLADGKKPQFDWSSIRQTIHEHVRELNAKNERDLTAQKVAF